MFFINREKGFSLLSLIASISILGIVLSYSLKHFLFLNKHSLKLSSKITDYRNKINLINEIKHLYLKANSIEGISNIKINEKNALFKNVNKDKKKKVGTDVISFRILKTEKILFSKKTNSSSNSINIRACRSKKIKNSYTNWLIVSPVGVISVIGKLKKHSSKYCKTNIEYRGKLTINKNSIFKNSTLSLKDVNYSFLLVPVESVFSLYVDNKNTLRNLSHSSLSNQPMIYNISSLKIKTIKKEKGESLIKISIKGLEEEETYTYIRKKDGHQISKILNILL